MAAISADERFMRAALREARKGVGKTSPNPAVGAVVVCQGKVAARGHHREAGAPHAEIECLKGLGRPVPAGAVLYLTLEPCSTVGRTPACTDAIIRSGIQTVVIGVIDPNPRHQGRAVKLLRDAGIEVRTEVLAAECAALNEAFNKWITTGLPLVIAKCGMSLDGRLSRRRGEPRQITGAAARRHLHRLRAQVDAILIGAETVRADDPRLTARGAGRAKQPWRVVLTRSGRLPRKARLFRDRFAKRTLVYRNQTLRAVLQDLGRKGVTSVLIEGGGEILGQARDARLIDQVQIYLGSILTGGPVIAFPGRGAKDTGSAIKLDRVSYARLGGDICVSGHARCLRPGD